MEMKHKSCNRTHFLLIRWWMRLPLSHIFHPLCSSLSIISPSISQFFLFSAPGSLSFTPCLTNKPAKQHLSALSCTDHYWEYNTGVCECVCVIILIYNMLTIRTECPLWMHLYMRESVFLHYIDCELNWENWSVSYAAHLCQSYICLRNVRRWQCCSRWEGNIQRERSREMHK